MVCSAGVVMSPFASGLVGWVGGVMLRRRYVYVFRSGRIVVFRCMLLFFCRLVVCVVV